MKNNNLEILKIMLEASTKVLDICHSLKKPEELSDNKLMFDIVIMNLVVIAESDLKLPEEIKSKYNFIAWQRIKEYKNIIASDYHQIDIYSIWDAIQNQLPFLHNQLNAIFTQLNQSEEI